MPGTRIDIRAELNNAMPATARARLGDVIYDLINKHNQLLALLEAAAVTGFDAPTVAALTVALPEARRGWPE